MVVDPEGAVRLVNIKGVGNTGDGKGTFNSRNYEGMLERTPAPIPAQLAAGTREVKASNSPKFESAGGVSNLPSLGIQHVYFLIKENRTYDQVFGYIANGNGDPKLVFLWAGGDTEITTRWPNSTCCSIIFTPAAVSASMAISG